MAASVPAAIAAAKAKLGAPYVWGATGPGSFDCSGLTQWAWRAAGVEIPRTSQAQATYGTAVQLDQIQAGDLVTSDWGSGPSSHVALYIGGGQVIHAPRPGKAVTYATLDESYAKHVNAIRRVPGASGAPASDGAKYADWDWNKINPFSPEYWENLARGGAAATDALGGTVLAPLVDVARGVASMAGSMLSIGTFATWLLKLALPSTWVRIAAGTFGAGFLFVGVYFLIRETRTAEEA